MTDALLIFTFSPVQSFIAEARRAADLYAGSQILVELARAAGTVLAENATDKRLIYPAELTDDVPNKLMATVPWEKCETIAAEARAALLARWQGLKGLAEEARRNFERQAGLPFDQTIWQRQTSIDYLWEIYWSAASLEGRSYRDAYQEADNGLAALKFTRPFAQVSEPGFKDSLSGKRQALCAAGSDGQQYWFQVGKVESITPIKVRPSTNTRPRERLDAIGVVKRFSPLAEKRVAPFHGFPSTSSMASATYLASAKTYCASELAAYQDAIARLLSHPKYVIRDDRDWPYDGDLFYPETLRPKRMLSDYGEKFSESNLEDARKALSKVSQALRAWNEKQKAAAQSENFVPIPVRPSPYYAIIMLDGDNMGTYLRTLDESEHRAFSASLHQFTADAKPKANNHLAKIIYNGGDDVLAMAPLKNAFPFARELATLFKQKTKRTASAGIVLAHHLSPLSHAIREAGYAELHAKDLDGKNAVCVIALKRSGEPIRVRSAWDKVGGQFEEMSRLFESDQLSSKLPYDLDQSAYGLPQADEKLQAELFRLIKRHLQKGTAGQKTTQARAISDALRQWAQSFVAADADNQPADQLADWLTLARFVAKGGQE